MRKTFLLLLLTVTVNTTASFAQSFAQVLDPAVDVIWLGLDFSMLRIVIDQNDWSHKDPHEMFNAWNEVVLKEKEKYNVAKALHREEVKFAIDVTMDHNAQVPVDSLFTMNGNYEYKTSILSDIVSSYDFKGNHGIGLMFIAESFNRPGNYGSFWVTFVNLDSKRIIYTQRMGAKPYGFGLRNLWIRPVYDILNKIKSPEYKRWRKAFKVPKKK